MCSDSEVEMNEEEMEQQRAKHKPTSASQFNATSTASATSKFVREAEVKKDATVKPPKMSKLSLLNLIGLAELGIVTIHLQKTNELDSAIDKVRQAIQDITTLNIGQQKTVGTEASSLKVKHGVASVTILEELLDNLEKIQNLRDSQKDKVLPLETKKLMQLGLNKDSVNFLLSHLKGECIISTREFNQVFFFTCLAPFIKPSMPNLNPTEAKLLQEKEKEIRKKLPKLR